jgi:putative cell wall-binding protein
LAGATAEQIIETYYTDASVGVLGDGGLPPIPAIFTNVASDLTITTLTVLAGPAAGNAGITVTRDPDGAPEDVTLLTGDSMTITDTTPTAGANGGCTVTFSAVGSTPMWGDGSCDFTAALTPGTTLPTNVIRATNCRTSYCTFGYGSGLHLVDNASTQRSVADPYKGFDLVVEASMDEYTQGIAEVPFSWDRDALEAQALVARSYGATWAVSANHLSAGCFCDLKNNSSYQVYAGWLGGMTMNDRWNDAALATSQMVVTHPDAPHADIVRAFYASSNGGASENNEDLWGGTPLAYLRSVDDPYSLDANPLSYWMKEVPLDAFSATLGFDVVTRVDIINRFVSGTPKVIEVAGLSGGSVITKCYGKYTPCVGAGSVVVGSGAGEIFDNLFGLYSAHIDRIELPGELVEVNRWWGQDRYATAAAISSETFPTTADTVYIATGENFPDALASAPLIAADPGPVLLVRKGSIPAATSIEIARLGPDRIVVLGGPAAVSDGVVATLGNYAPTSRIAGADRYITAADMAKVAYPTTAHTVYIAVGTSFADALVAGPAAVAQDAPVLLVQSNAIPMPTRNALNRLKPTKIVVVGGGSSVSSSVVSALASFTTGSVVSIAGSDRYGTSALVAEDAFPAGSGTVYLASGLDFPDALAAGAAAALSGSPVLLVQPSSLPNSVAVALADLGPDIVVVLGGTAAIGDSVIGAVHNLLG